MNSQPQEMSSQDEGEIRDLYRQVLERWNLREASAFAGLFEEDGNIVGFDGSQVNGRAEIEAHLSEIFADHSTAAYLGIIREVRFLSPETAVLRAVVGMTPPGKSELNPAANAVQSLVAVKRAGKWRVALYQNTPAQFHGRPELAQALTEELQRLLE